MNFDHLKKVPPIDNPAPDIRPGDKPWSEVFEEAVTLIENRSEDFLCHAVSTQLGYTSNQAERMQHYIFGLMPTDDLERSIRFGDRRAHYTVGDWIEVHNGADAFERTNMTTYRAAWARHLAEQFRRAGL